MKNSIKIALAASMFILVVFANVFPATGGNLIGRPQPEKAHDGFAVVELFTSEGCSSCPPADALLAKLEKETAGQNVYLLAYHVDYWDRLGWKDSFSSAQYTARQREYSTWMNLGVMYTPQFVVNGSSQFAGENKGKLYGLVSKALQRQPTSTLALEVVEGQDSFSIGYEAAAVGKNLQLHVAVVQREAAVNVKRGENGGRRLHHAQVVHELNTIVLDKKAGKLIINKPETFNSKDWEIIGFTQDGATGVITAGALATFNPIKNQ